MTNQGNASRNDLVNRIIRAVVLIVVALILAVVSVSFAVHHMRLKFEDEYRGITQDKMSQVSSIIQLSVNGDEIVHLIGKEISRFHCIYWPIFLHALDIKLPTTILAHGWIITPEGKMSKSKGNVINPLDLLEKYDSEIIKYFFKILIIYIKIVFSCFL